MKRRFVPAVGAALLATGLLAACQSGPPAPDWSQGRRVMVAEGPRAYTTNIVEDTMANTDFRKEVHTTPLSQVVLMSIEPGDDIGRESHPIDQVLVVVSGSGEYTVGPQRGTVKHGDLVVVPANTEHNIVNTGKGPLKLYTIYTPPQHPAGTVHATKADAKAAEAAKGAKTAEPAKAVKTGEAKAP